MPQHTRSSFRLGLCTALVLASGLPLAARAEVLVNGNFESQPNFGNGLSGDAGYSLLTGTQIPGWTIRAGYGATVHNTVLYPTISGNYSVNMDGEGYLGHNADLYQDFSTVPGATYTFDFDWSTWVYSNSSTLKVTITGTGFQSNQTQYSGTFSALTTSAVQHVSASFVGNGGVLRLEVQAVPVLTGTNDNTFMVDNFSVNAVVPEAPAAALWLAGLAGLAVLRRRGLR